MLRKLILVLLLLAISAAGWAASFDCGKAGTKVEKMICSDAELSSSTKTAFKAPLFLFLHVGNSKIINLEGCV